MTSVKPMKGVFIMKKTLFVGPIVLLAVLLSLNTASAQMGPGMMGRGYGMGPGMMGQGQGMRPGYGYGPRYQQPQKALEEKDVKPILENYLKSTRNPNLKLGKIEDKESTFEAEIMTKDDSLVDKIAVDKNTGWMRSIY